MSYTLQICTADGEDHGLARIEDCLEAVIYRFEDGYVLCPILWSGGSCEGCMEIFEKRIERFGELKKKQFEFENQRECNESVVLFCR